ncbi:hypothetical protein FIU94_10025 [Sulfitobacter sp. THAF37]|uniref:hypothetical protein n=1 Tax=Sulfitobacter sp. THAF37 TaxID=2587855 RepID=UPI001267C9ED|nr:hypothetical protein [Sulfitobacter sp. THAF37]QFT59162.1 hypothetical protein FIU94_10025 [Sulfitobacter sp. THAF37]
MYHHPLTGPHPIVLQMEGITPDQLAKYRAHAERTAENYPQVDHSRTPLNFRIIGEEDWLENALDEIEGIRLENFEKEFDVLKTANRKNALETRRTLLQIRVHWFDSGTRLHYFLITGIAAERSGVTQSGTHTL